MVVVSPLWRGLGNNHGFILMENHTEFSAQLDKAVLLHIGDHFFASLDSIGSLEDDNNDNCTRPIRPVAKRQLSHPVGLEKQKIPVGQSRRRPNED